MIGTARESVNKLLHSWQRAGIVSLRRGAIAIRRADALKELAEGGASLELGAHGS
jgi:hypothetical protein